EHAGRDRQRDQTRRRPAAPDSADDEREGVAETSGVRQAGTVPDRDIGVDRSLSAAAAAAESCSSRRIQSALRDRSKGPALKNMGTLPDRHRCLELYRAMLTTRLVEESFVPGHLDGTTRCPVHLYSCQEAEAAGLCQAVR